MTRIAGAVHWTDRPLPREQGAAMLAPVAAGSPSEPCWRTRGAVGLGSVPRAAARFRRPWHWLADGSLGIAADARLFDRAALCRRLEGALELPPAPDDQLLLLAAYRRWGDDLLERVRGEFAFAIWDAERRRLLAARDPFGVRPLVYRSEPDRLLFASEPKQILTLRGVPVEPDELLLGEYLLGRFEEVERTFFAGLRRLPAAHCLVARAGRVEVRRWWTPDPARLEHRPRTGEAAELFRRSLERAVDRRLETARPVLAHLSGGLDSSSVVASAARCCERARTSRAPRVETVSCLFPRLPCDESAAIAAFVATSPFAHHAVRPAERSPLAGLDDDLWTIDSPFVDLQRGLFEAIAEVARARGAGALLTGLGGDEVAHEDYSLRDLAARRRWPRLLLESWRGSFYSHNSFPALLKDAIAPRLPPGLRRLSRRLRGRPAWVPPDWATAGFVERFLAGPAPPPPPAAGFASETQESVLRYVNYPDLAWCLEAFDARAAALGLRAAHPFFDRDLVECVLAMPLDERLAGGRWKRLLRDGPGAGLPPVIREQRRKTTFESLERHLLARWGRELEARLFDGGGWHAGRYVSRAGARRLVQRAVTGGASYGELRQAWRVASVELWLAQLPRYNESASITDSATPPRVARSADAPPAAGEGPGRQQEDLRCAPA